MFIEELHSLPPVRRLFTIQVVITVDVLRRGGVTTVIGGLTGCSLVECSRGVKLFPDTLLEDALKLGPFDVVIIPGGLQV